MEQYRKDEGSIGGLAVLVFVGMFALFIATSAAGRWLASIAPVPAPKAAPVMAPAAPASPQAPAAAPDTSGPIPQPAPAPSP